MAGTRIHGLRFCGREHLEKHRLGQLGHFIGSFSRCLCALKYSYNVLSMTTQGFLWNPGLSSLYNPPKARTFINPTHRTSTCPLRMLCVKAMSIKYLNLRIIGFAPDFTSSLFSPHAAKIRFISSLSECTEPRSCYIGIF